MDFCKTCNIGVSDLRKHLKRNRCRALKDRRLERGQEVLRVNRGRIRKGLPEIGGR